MLSSEILEGSTFLAGRCLFCDFMLLWEEAAIKSILVLSKIIHPFIPVLLILLISCTQWLVNYSNTCSFSAGSVKQNKRMSKNGKKGWAVLKRTKIDFAAASFHRNLKSQKNHQDRKVDPSGYSELNMHLWYTFSLIN